MVMRTRWQEPLVSSSQGELDRELGVGTGKLSPKRAELEGSESSDGELARSLVYSV